ncbi:MAG TPA: hypothetical protein DD490_00195, partial [Acidobacteria bacterium]|nr:hypothetical protein [Acidobacteriota bacterium]
MLSEVLRFEVRYHARQPAFLAAVALFVLFGFALASGRFGADNVAVNGPYLILQAFALQSLAALFAAGVFAAQAVLRDDDHRMREIIHATPVGSFPYLIGRWGGAFLATLALLACASLGTAVGALMPWVPAERLVAWDVRPFLAAFGTITIPNVLFVSVVLFAVAVLTRSAIATHAAAVSLYALYFVGAALTDSPLLAGARPGGGGGALAALLDPFGLTGVFDVTRYWTAAEKNARLLPLEGVLLLNRGLWVAAALGILALVHRRFSFRMRNEPAAKTDRQGEEAPASGPAARPWSALPKLHPVPASGLAAYRSCVQVELRSLGTKSTWFLLLVWIAWAFSEIYGGLAGDYRSVSNPATSLLLAALQTPASIAGSLLLLYFAAELFWREQRVRMAPLVDSTPVSGAVLLAAKGTALAALLGAVLLTGAAAGLAIQLGRGFFQIEPGLYLAFFYFTGAPLLLYAAAALFLHALSPGKYAGMILSAAFLILSRRAAAFGLEHDLWRFAGTPPVRYSALNGFAQDATPFHAFLLHWAVVALLLAVSAAGLWRRVGAPLRDRLPLLLRPGRTAGGLAVLSLVTGGWIFYNTNVATAYVTASDLNDWKSDYEKTYRSIEALPRPRVLAVEGNVDLFPATGRYRVAGRYALANASPQPITTVYVATRREAGRVALSMPGGRLVAQDERFGMTRFDLQPPLAPGARTELRFDLTFSPRGFVARQ